MIVSCTEGTECTSMVLMVLLLPAHHQKSFNVEDRPLHKLFH